MALTSLTNLQPLHVHSVGISTFDGSVSVGGTLTYEDVTNVDAIGIITARSGVNVSGGQLDIGSNIKIGNAGVITATSFVGSGANLTSLPAQATIANNADNRIITGGSGVNLNGESNLTFTGSALNVIGTIDADDVISVDGSSNVDLRIQTSANNRLVLRGASSLSSIITQNNNNLSFRHDGGTSGGSEIFLMNSNGIDVGNNKRIQIKDYYGDVSGRIENSDSTNNSLRIDVDPDDSGASSVFMVRIDGNELVRLNHNGKFGIGMNDPAATLHVGGGADTSPQVRIQRTSGYNNAWKIYQSHYGASDQGTLFLQPTLATTPNVEITNAAGAMAMRVDSDTGVISVKSGGGIDFSAAAGSNAGSSSAVLDDYEEGSFTAILRSNSNPGNTGYNYDTSSNFTSYYTKIGNIVYVSISMSNLHTSPDLRNHQLIRVEGLPFTTARRCGINVVDGRGIYPRWSSDSQTTNAATTTVWADGSDTKFYLQFYMHYVPYTAWATVANSTSSQRWHLAGCYPVA